MRCILCDGGLRHIQTLEADKYQALINHTGQRIWKQCTKCGLYVQHHYLSNTNLRFIYEKYRDKTFRHDEIKNTFEKILSLNEKDSENMYRFSWFASQVDSNHYDTILDIGSGLGVWPYLLHKTKYSVTCVEPNRDSAKFINNDLGIYCSCSFFNSFEFPKYDVVTIIHLLEHIRDPVTWLRRIKDLNLESKGLLFIEVPDDSEFGVLPFEHDEYNSTHLYFFGLKTLANLIQKAGLKIMSSHVAKYDARNLTRLMVLCENS